MHVFLLCATALLRGSFDESIELIPLHLRMMKYLKYPDGAKEQVSMAKNATKKSDGEVLRRLVWAEEVSETRVWSGNRGGLKKSDLLCVRGKIVSKKLSESGKASPWIAAVIAARKALNITTGSAVIKKDTALYKKAKELHNLMQSST